MPPPVADDPEALALAARLKQARERLGVSVRELARLTGIPAATISAMERGRDPRWSTLIRYLETVPGLRAADLLPGPIHCPPAASPSLFAYVRRAHGAGARDVVVSRRALVDGRVEERIEVRGMVTEFAESSVRETALCLMRLVAMAPKPVIRSMALPAPGVTRIELCDGETRHSFEFSPEEPVSLDYVRTRILAEEAATVRSVEHVAAFPIGRLTFDVELPPGEVEPRPRLFAWLESRRMEGPAGEIGAFLYSGRVRPTVERAGGRMQVTLKDVLPELVHVVTWDATDGGVALEARCEHEGAPSFAPIARALRARSGRSARDLAEIMGVSHVTLGDAEKGSDVRASTLRRYRRALPEVAPQWLLPSGEAIGKLLPEEAWSALRDLHGIEAEEVVRTCTLAADGSRRVEDTYTRVRALGAAERTITVSQFAATGSFATGRYVILDVETDAAEAEEDMRSRLRRADPRRPIQDLVLPSALTRRGLSWRTHRDYEPSLFLSREAARAHYMSDEPVIGGFGMAPIIPARRLRVVLRAPAGFRPALFWATALPIGRAPSLPPHRILDVAHPGLFEWTSSAGTDHHELSVTWPLSGLSYAIGWEL